MQEREGSKVTGQESLAGEVGQREEGKEPVADVGSELKKLQRLLEEERRRSEESLTKLKYLQADFENYRKRIDKEIKEIEDFSTGGLVRKLLTVLDELELAVKNAEKRGEKGPFLEGIKMIYKNLFATLEREGLRRIEAVGKEFDPELHEAVEKVEAGKHEKDIVVEEIRSGFTFKDQVLRPSLVKVEVGKKQAGGADKNE